MARHAEEREDLLRDATAFDRRIQLQIPHQGDTSVVFAGFRPDGTLSLYWNADPVWHFNSRRELRRAYVSGKLLKAEKGQLVALNPVRDENTTVMVREVLSEEQHNEVRRHMLALFETLQKSLEQSQFSMDGQHPADSDVLKLLVDWLHPLPDFCIARKPNVA